MAQKPPPKNSGELEGLSALERYLAKQKKERAELAAKEAAALPKSKGLRTPFSKAGLKVGQNVSAGPAAGNSKPSLHGIERPPSHEPPQPESLRRWESVADSRLSEAPNEAAARELGVPTAPLQASHSVAPKEPARGGDFGPRFLATLIDLVFVTMASWVLRSMVFVLVPIGSFESQFLGLKFFIGLIVTYFYYGYFYSTKAASPGKILLGLEVYDVDGHTKLSYGKAFFREAVGKCISTIPFFMGYVIVLIRDDRRALHDLLFDTRVIKKP